MNIKGSHDTAAAAAVADAEGDDEVSVMTKRPHRSIHIRDNKL